MNVSDLKQLTMLQLFTIYLRYLIGGAFVFASIVKIQGQRFTTDSGASAPIHDAWHFFETLYQSGLYWQFLGWGQLIAGFLLMTQVLSTLGAVMFFPIILNIFVITISYYFAGTPIITFLMLLANTYLLVWDWNRLKVVVLPTQSTFVDEVYPLMRRRSWAYLGLFYACLSILAKLTLQSFLSVLLVFGIALIAGILVLIYTLKEHKRAVLSA
ncbi:hypothetical protein [Spirosoma linguale]|uniref:DoxX family protein n=1 Tax=Spirosoma linguale (strain ATCC 33905 / DSM 74 / LMG 10896 / Claus 1) TaxID=504472 RepID=D2QQU8_SPILD|nr:hypothetical protein Slin_1755 [Spirosoma linguale DSM 74]